MVKTSWCVIVNRQTCSTGWKKRQSFLEKNGISYTLHQTQTTEEAKTVLSTLYHIGHRHYLFVGGDGTIHHGGNVLMELAGDQSHDITIGVLPCGTGNDWVRTYGTTKKKLATNLREEYTAPLNVIQLIWPDGRTRYAFNMVGGALDAAVVANLKRTSLKIPAFILYPYGLLKTLMKPHTWSGTIISDGHPFQGDILTIQAGFAKYCGGGMYVLPHAREDSAGLLIMKPKSLIRLLLSMHTIYNGQIVHQKEAVALHFDEMEITHEGIAIPIEADGEWLGTSPVRLKARYGVMRRIV
jgi:diacylglycerol kinase family enzyme